MASELTWKGYAVHDTKKYTELKLIDFKPKEFGDLDIDIAISHCGVCGSDCHTVTGGWGDPILPLITGHEVVGIAKKVGPKVTSVKVGDRVGVGAQVWACTECSRCKAGQENYCPKQVDTYNAKYPNGDIAHGGYGTAIRAHELFVFPIPKELDSADAAPMLCGGLTVFSPLKRNGAGPGKNVGVVGLGGLGHFAVLFAKALGARVTVFSHSDHKRSDAEKMGADNFVITSEKDFAEKHADQMDLIVVTADVAKGIPIPEMASMMKVNGRIIIVAMPDDPLPEFQSAALASSGVYLGGSHIGNRTEALEMLDIAAKKGVKPWIEQMPMKDAGKAIQSVIDNKVRYRHVLKQDII